VRPTAPSIISQNRASTTTVATASLQRAEPLARSVSDFGNQSPPLARHGIAMDALLQSLLQKLVPVVRAANSLPSSQDFKYYSSFESFSVQRMRLTEQIARLIDRLHLKILPSERTSIVDFEDECDKFEVFSRNCYLCML
jgi:hypothetical protein